MKKSLLIMLSMVSVATLKPMMPDPENITSKNIRELELELDNLPAEVKAGIISNKWTSLVKTDFIQPAKRKYVKDLYKRTNLEYLIKTSKITLELEDTRKRLADLTASNTSLQKSLEVTNDLSKRQLEKLEALNKESQVEKGSFEQEIGRLKKSISSSEESLKLATKQMLKSTDDLRLKNQALVDQQAKAKEQESQLLKKNQEVLSNLQNATNLTSEQKKQILVLERNTQILESRLAANKDLLNECLMNKGLFESRQKQPSALTRLMNWWRSKK